MSAVRLFAVSVVLTLFTLPSTARAAFVYCNQTQAPLEAAFGYREQGGWISEGWWRLEPGQCARVFGKPLTQRFYFYYARLLTPPAANGKPPLNWSGKYAFCIDTKAFRVEGDGNCESRGYREQGFQEVDVGPDKRDYTLNFRGQ